MFKFLKSKKEKREEYILKNCGCICYCSNCNEPLNDTAKCVEKEIAIYEYHCNSCGHKSMFHFGIAPVPILLDK